MRPSRSRRRPLLVLVGAVLLIAPTGRAADKATTGRPKAAPVVGQVVTASRSDRSNACSAAHVGCRAAVADPPPRYVVAPLPMAEFMGHVVDPASFAFWKGAGTEETAQGARDLSPTSEEGWDDVVSGAAVLIEAGNMLQLPGRPQEIPGYAPKADWMKWAQALSAEAVLGKAAAERRDANGVFVQGAKIYQVCLSCHQQYKFDPDLRANGPAQGNPLPSWPASTKAMQQIYSARAQFK